MTRRATDEEIALVVRYIVEHRATSWVGADIQVGSRRYPVGVGIADWGMDGTLDEVFTSAADYIRGLGGSRDTDRIYPCDRCGFMRTKAEGGTTFTVCDKCWDETHKEQP